MDKKKFVSAAALTAVFSAAAIFAMYFDAKPVWIGLPVCLILVVCAGMIAGEFAGAATGVISTSVGLYLNINHYFLPEKFRSIPEGISPEKLEKLEKSIASFHAEAGEYASTIAPYSLIIIIFAGLLGFIAGKWLNKLLKNTVKTDSKTPNKAFSSKKLTYMSMFIALAVAINTFRIGNISFSGFPIICSGFVLGPVPGFLVGGIADIVGFLVRPSGNAFNVAFTLTSALTGFIPAILIIKGNKQKFLHIFIAIFVGQIITSILLVPLFRLWLFEHPLIATMTSAAIKQAYSIPLYAFFYTALERAIGANLRAARSQ